MPANARIPTSVAKQTRQELPEKKLSALRKLPRPLYGQAETLPNQTLRYRHSHGGVPPSGVRAEGVGFAVGALQGPHGGRDREVIGELR